MVNFLIVDDHPIFRHGLIALIQSEPRYRVIAEAGSAAEALAAIAREVPDVLLLDISLGEGNGLDLLKVVHAAHPEVRVLVVSIHDESVYAERALRAQARGYLMKQEASSVLKEAIATILAGKVFVSAAYRDRLLEKAWVTGGESSRPKASLLSDREFEVLESMGRGLGAMEIASSMGISVKTVGVYQDHIKKKLSIDNISELRKYAVAWMQGH
jgi:DNA-binding NarL/FixJ family response regulator